MGLMGDYRHCDGPNCDEIRPLNDPFLETWITVLPSVAYRRVSEPEEQDLHFHTKQCLTEWVKETTRV